MDATVTSLHRRSGGQLVAGGDFIFAGGVNVNRIATWNGTAWFEYGTGVDGPVSMVHELPGGDVLTGGTFTNAGFFLSPFFGRWTCPVCDPVDFNRDGLFPDTQDIIDFITVMGGGNCLDLGAPCSSDIDYNNDGLYPDTSDIAALIAVFGGGACQ